MSFRILVVDDDPNIRQLIRQPLENAGHCVFEAENGVLAADWIKANPCDLALVDVVMPEMDGVEFTYVLRRENPTLPLIAMSAGEELMPRELSLGMMECLGADEILPKPFDIGRLLDTVNDVMVKTADRRSHDRN